MTKTYGNDNELNNQKIIFLPKELTESKDEGNDKKYKIFKLPNPSQIVDKADIEILLDPVTSKIYQLQPYEFKSEYLVEAQKQSAKKIQVVKKTVADEIDVTARSLMLYNSDPEKRADGYVLRDASMSVVVNYDVTFNLISNFCKKQISHTEEEYVKEDGSKDNNNNNKFEAENKILTLRDYHDYLIDFGDKNWEHVPLENLKQSLERISEVIEEAGDTYYKITVENILMFLSKKVNDIIMNFPKSIPIPYGYPEDIKYCAKVLLSCNILISLIPKLIYNKLVNDISHKLSDDQTISGCIDKYISYKKDISISEKEKKLLTQSAMKIGLGNGGPNNTDRFIKKVVKKAIVPKTKIAVGRGAIDGFFKKK